MTSKRLRLCIEMLNTSMQSAAVAEYAASEAIKILLELAKEMEVKLKCANADEKESDHSQSL